MTVDVDIDGVEVRTRTCHPCGVTFYVIYEEEEANVSLDTVADQIGLSGSVHSTSGRVLGSHRLTCPKCGEHLSMGQMVKMKIAGYLWKDK